MTTEMSYAQALNEARQFIIQQANRIKFDAEKIRAQQQMLTDQSSRLSESEQRRAEQANSLQRQGEEIQMLTVKLKDTETARDQADTLAGMQRERIASMQADADDLGRRLSEQSERVVELTSERDNLLAQLPSKEDVDALDAMCALLSKRASHTKSTAAATADASTPSGPGIFAEQQLAA